MSIKDKNSDRAKLVSEFLSNIGVAWFTAGVIGIFISGAKGYNEILTSLGWGIGFSSFFLFSGMISLKK
jgi:hypothetical protein